MNKSKASKKSDILTVIDSEMSGILSVTDRHVRRTTAVGEVN